MDTNNNSYFGTPVNIDQILELERRYCEFKNETFKMHNEIEQIAAKALGYYPAYRDDPKNFPNVSQDDDTVCIGDHTTETIVAVLAEKYKKLKAENKRLKQTIQDLILSADSEWETHRQGHDWADAIEQARQTLKGGE